jgi:hypothetical protein
MVPGAASKDLVAPIINLTVFIALVPSSIHAMTKPDEMNFTKSLKNALSLCGA